MEIRSCAAIVISSAALPTASPSKASPCARRTTLRNTEASGAVTRELMSIVPNL